MRMRVFVTLVLLIGGSIGLALAQSYQFSDVVIEGNRRVETSAIRSVISTAPGQSVSMEDIDADIRAIYKLGRFKDVQAEVSERNGATILIYRLEERPLVRKVEFEGNKELSTDKLTGLVVLKTPDIYDPGAVDRSVKAIKDAYLEEGFYAAQVDPEIEINDQNEASIIFQIEEGEKVLVDTISFEGNKVFSDKQLKKVMVTKERWFLSWLTGRGTYQEEMLQNDLEIIADQYYNEGYVQVKVKQPQVTLSEDQRLLTLLIEVEEGDQFRVGEVDVQGDLLKSKEEILELIKLRPGDVFSRKQLRSDVFSVNDLYADQGYAYVNVSPLTSIDPEKHLVSLKFDIEQGIQVHIDQIRITGNTKTRDKVIRREMKLAEGDLYSATQLKESRRKINNLGFFEEVNVSTAKAGDPAHMDVNVEVKERPTGTFSLGAGYSSVDGIIGQGSVSQENFLGRGLKLNLSGSFGGRSTTYTVGLLEPYFLDKNLSLGFDVYKTEREWTDFTKKTVGGDIKLGFPLGEDNRAFFIYRYEEKEILDVDDEASLFIRDQEGTSTLSSLSGSLTRNTTDYRLDPSKGYVAEGSIEFAGLGGTQKFSKYILDYRHFFPFKWGTVFSAHGQLGYVQRIGGEDVPIDERFFLGGINSLRGFNSREVGPRVRRSSQGVDPNTGIPIGSAGEDFEFIGGNKEAFFNLEYVFPIIKDLGLKGLVFFDTGNAWSEDEEYFSNMRYSVGTGIRWFSPMGPLRLELGYNPDPREDEDTTEWQFSIGRFF